MGMAATQARFLGLTARKTNIEFEGQQINQQRTCLSNESASYYSRLTALSVPTPPSTQDYSKISYTFTDGSETNTINQLIATRDISGETGIYLVNYTKKVKADSIVSNGTVIVSRVNNNPTPELTAKEGYELGEIPNVGKAHTELLINDKDTTNDKIIYFDKDGKQLVDITDGKTAKEQYDEIVKNKDKDYGYMIGHTTLRTLGSTPAADDPYYSTLTDTEKANALAMENQYIQILT